MIVNSCQCIGQHQLQVFTVRAQKANLLCNVIGRHTCGFLGCDNECTLHPDYGGESFIILFQTKVMTNLGFVISKINQFILKAHGAKLIFVLKCP